MLVIFINLEPQNKGPKLLVTSGWIGVPVGGRLDTSDV